VDQFYVSVSPRSGSLLC
jgi:hypothetical protein